MMRLARLALRILQNRVGAVPRPSWCTYLVTYRCNARCGMCDSWRMKPVAEMTPAEVGVVFAKLGRLDVVRLTGGEPFLRTDLPHIVEQVLAQSRPAVVHISTNGSFSDRAVDLVRRCTAPRKLRFMISLDGLAEEHDRNRGRHAPFAQARETIRRLAELRSTHGVRVSVNHTVISPQSLADHAELRRSLADDDVEVHSVLAYADSATYGAESHGTKAEHLIVPDGYPLHPALEGADVLGFVQQELSRVDGYRSAALRWGKRYYLRGLLARLQHNESSIRARAEARGTSAPDAPAHATGASTAPASPEPRTPNPPCVALRSHIRLLPDGSVPVCQFNGETVGNLLTQSLPEIWHGQSAASSRAWVDACPGCWAECEVIPSAIYSGDLLRHW